MSEKTDPGHSTVPADPAPAKSAPMPLSHREITPQDPLRVLIVEDSKIVSERLVAMTNGLQKSIAVSTAENGATATKRFQENSPDVVVLDIALPDISGFDLLTQFKTQDPQCVVLMLTTYSYSEFRTNALRLGADFFFSKTMEFENVADVIAALANGGQEPLPIRPPLPFPLPPALLERFSPPAPPSNLFKRGPNVLTGPSFCALQNSYSTAGG